MMDLARENVRLREQLEMKDAEIAELRRLIADDDVSFPPCWKLTRIQGKILRFLLKRRAAPREQIHAFLYGDQENGGPELENVRVHICLLRKKLKPLGIGVVWRRECGYCLPQRMKQQILRFASDR